MVSLISCTNYKNIDATMDSNMNMPSIRAIMDVVKGFDANSSEEVAILYDTLLEKSNYALVDSGTYYNLAKEGIGVNTIKYFCIGKGDKERKIYRKPVYFEEGILFKYVENLGIGLRFYFANRKEMLAFFKEAEDTGYEHLDYGKYNFFLLEDVGWALHPYDEKNNVVELKWE